MTKSNVRYRAVKFYRLVPKSSLCGFFLEVQSYSGLQAEVYDCSQHFLHFLTFSIFARVFTNLTCFYNKGAF